MAPTRERSSDKGTIAIGFVQEALVDVARRGLDAHALLVAAGISPELLNAPQARVSSAHYGRLWHLIAEATDLRALQADFTLAAEPARDGLQWVKAVPKTKDGQLQQVQVGFDGDKLAALEAAPDGPSRPVVAAARAEPAPEAAPVTRLPTVMVVDDSLNTREIEKDVLEAYGYHVTLAEDGLDGLNKAQEGDFDAVLTDVEMPGMDGFSLTARLRQEEKYRNRPIIIVTSREKEEDKRRGIEAGADAYIVKGDFDQNNLVDTLRTLLG